MNSKTLLNKYAYNSYSHGFGVDIGKLQIQFVLPDFRARSNLNVIYEGNVVRVDTSKKYYHINRRNFIYRPVLIDNHRFFITDKKVRKTQGMFLALAQAFESVSYVSTAVSTVFMYKLASNSFNFFDRHAQVPNKIWSFIKEHLVDVGFVLINFAFYYDGKLGLSEFVMMLTAYATTRALLKAYLPDIISYIKNLVPGESTRRHTQGKDNLGLAATAISLFSIAALGYAVEPTTAKAILTSIRGLGSSLLAAKTMESIICTIFEYIPDVLHAVLCEKVPLLAMYAKLSTDPIFKRMIENLVKLRFEHRSEIFYNSHKLHEFFELRSELMRFCLHPENISRGFTSLMKDHVALIDDIYKEADEKGLVPNRRKLPFVVWLSGDPGVGKSTYAKSLAKMFVADCLDTSIEEVTDDDMARLVYSYNSSNKFFDGYNNQPVFILNDYLQFAQTGEEELLIRFVDTVDCMLEPSSVDNSNLGIKGEVRFTSRVIIVTSNTSYLSSSPNIVNLQAFNRRRDVVIEMSWKSGQAIDYSNFDYSWANFKILPPIRNLDVFPTHLDSIYDVQQHIINVYIQKEGNARVLVDNNVRDETISSRLLRINDEKNYLESFKQSIYDAVSKFLNFNVLGVPVKYLIPIITIGTASYQLFKQTVKLVMPRSTQSLSGDVSTSKLKKKTRTLQRVTMGYQNNIYETANVIRKNMCPITTLATASNGQILSFSMWCLGLGGTLYVTPKHLWRRGSAYMKDGDSITINFKGKNFDLKFSENKICYVKDADIAFYNFFGDLPPIKDISHLLVHENIEVDENGEACVLITPKEEISQLVPVTSYIVDNAPYSDPLGEVYEGVGMWQYNTPMSIGDCGSALLLTGKNFEKKLAGIHVAGDAYSGNSEVLTYELYKSMLDSFSARRSTQGFCTNADYIPTEDGEPSLEGEFLYLGNVKLAPFQATNTEIVRGPLFEALQPCQTGPAVLAPFDPRLQEPVSPIQKSVEKYGVCIKPFNKQLLRCAFKIVSEFYAPIKQYQLRKFTANEAINSKYTPNLEKLDLKTSAGYPWNIRKLKKEDLIVNDNGVYTIKQELGDKIRSCENMLEKNIMFPYTLTTTLKDERVSLSKIAIGKTRTFMNFPVEYTILMRMYFDDFIDKETRHAMDIGTTSGVNIYSSQWNILYNMLNKYDYALDGDFKAFDGSIRPEFFVLYSKLVNSLYNDGCSHIRDLLMNGCCFAPIFVLNEVYVKMQGNPSGSRVTTSFNSFVNRMYVVMSILECVPQHCWTYTFFEQNFKMFAHGDDHLIGFNKAIQATWDGYKLQQFMLKHGIDYTSSQKDKPLTPFRELKDCYYLKSYFVWDSNRKMYRAGLDKAVIQEMVSWQRDTTLDSTKMIVNTALRYAYFWGPEYFDEIREKLLSAMKRKFLWFTLVNYEDLDIEYNYSDQLVFSYTQ